MKINQFELSELSSELMHDILSDINKSKRELFVKHPRVDMERREFETISEATRCSKTFTSGSLPQIRGRITTSLVNLSMPEQQHGGFMVKRSNNGSFQIQVRLYGFMGNVRVLRFNPFPVTHKPCFCSGSGKKRAFVRSPLLLSPETNRMSSSSSSIIQDIRGMCTSGLATLAFFYCDFREDQKKDRRGLLPSLLVQLCYQSDSYCVSLSKFYMDHGRGSQHASDNELLQCLKHVLDIRKTLPR
jgi:hypothetical protein